MQYSIVITTTSILPQSPRIGLSLKFNSKDNLTDYSAKVASIIRTGGLISILKKESRSLNGVHKFIGNKVSSGTIATLQSLSINLPRLAYQSNKDETYFRARLALMIKPALSAMSIRKKALIDLMRKGMLPTLASRHTVYAAWNKQYCN